MSADIFFPLQPVCISDATPRWETNFFPYPWAHHAEIGNVCLRIQTKVPLHVSVREGGPVGRSRVQQPCLPGVSVLSFGRPETCGDYLTCTIEGEIGPDTIIEWGCSQPPVRTPSLAVIICTYNRDKHLRLVLDALARQHNALGHICIVNQGQPGLEARIRQETDPSCLQIVEQPNYGGAGGFTRGIIESLKQRSITHFLLMDDDVEISDTLIIRLRAICAYIPDSACIGGTMLDIHNPESIVSLGNNVDLQHSAVRDIIPNTGLQLNDEKTLEYIAKPPQVDFCGWWCFCMPRQAIEQCGLPLPLFIRGDDAEYGFRLTRAGFHTIMWPGITVKHNALTSQTRAWHHFYDRRNALLLTLLYNPVGQHPSIGPLIRGIINALVTYRYDFAEAGIDALIAYQRGGKALAVWDGKSHQALVARGIPDEPASDRQPVAISRYPTALSRTVITAIRIIKDYFSHNSEIKKSPVIQNSDWVSGTKYRPRALFCKSGTNFTYLHYDSIRFRHALRFLIKALFNIYFYKHPSVKEIKSMTTVSWWEKFLDIPT